MLKTFFTKMVAVLTALFTLLIGKITWQTPTWLTTIGRYTKAHPRFYRISLVGLLLVLLSGIGLYKWYQHLPKQEYVSAHITVPSATPLSTQIPEKLIIDFGVDNGGFQAKSVAPLKDIGKTIKEVRLTPSLAGTWNWQTESQLVFTPETDWPADQTYTIEFNKKTFTAKTKLAKLTYSFSTQPFTAKIADFKFYQDPINMQQRQVVATINFNYPVDPKNFEKHIRLNLQALRNGQLDLSAQPYHFTVNYDEYNRTAYIRSENLKLPEVERYLELTIEAGIKAATNDALTHETEQQSVLIPDIGSYFKVNQIDAAIVRNQQDTPEQILTVDTTVGITERELSHYLQVYLLPTDYPSSRLDASKQNYRWQVGDITAAILAQATPVNLAAIPTDRDYATLHSYKLATETPRYMYVRLHKGARGFGDYVLNQDYATVIQVPAYPQEINFLHKGALLALNSEKKLSVVVRGLPAVKFTIARILPDDLNQLVTQTRGNFSDPEFINDSFNQNNISDIFSETKTFASENPAEPQYTALDIGKYLNKSTNTAGPHGLFILKAQGWDEAKQTNLYIQTNRLILITDLGMVVKDNNDGTHDVFVQSITQGNPVANVKIAILGKNGLPILTKTTDATGHANFPSVKDFINEREPVAYLASAKDDVSFIPFNLSDRQLNFSKFDVGGQYTNANQQSLSAYLFSDRGIYRPGDTAHIGMIVKETYLQPQPANLPLQVIVTDPRGATILDKKIQLDTAGLSTIDIATHSVSPTGQYTVNLYIVNDDRSNNFLGSTTIQVEEFQPDRMRIAAHLSEEPIQGWLSPTEVSAQVDLWNLYGTPAANRKITGRIVLVPQSIKFANFPNYVFIDPLLDPKKPLKTFSDELTEQTTDAEGKATFDLKLERFEKATYQLNFYAQGFEAQGGRSVNTEAKVLVSPLTYFVGYKADSDLNYIKQNSEHTINFIAINPALKQQDLTKLKLKVSALQPISTLVKNADGTYQYQSVIQSTARETLPFAISQQGTPFMLPTKEIGNFTISILDENEIELSHFKYSVIGASQQALSKNAELTIKLNKSSYAPGEEIELQLTSPYTGAGLITLERDRVYTYQWFKTDTTNSIQKIRIPADFQGDGYVNITFVRDFNSPEIFMNPLSFSIAPFQVNYNQHKLLIDLAVPPSARPGTVLPIQYKSDKPGKIVIFAIDEGILQVADYTTPDPLAFFFQKHALEVLTQQTVDQILPKFVADRELSAVGGDEAQNMLLKSNLNPFKRKTDLPVAFWSGILDVETTPKTISYTIPDYFNGSLRIMAVGVSDDDAANAVAKNTEVKGDFIISPNVPTVAAPGDEFVVTATIANNVKDSGKDAPVAIHAMVSPQLTLQSDASQTIAINEGQEQSVKFKVKTTDALGSGSITLVAKLGEKESKMTSTFSLRPASPYLTTVKSGSNDKTLQLQIDRNLFPENRKVDATAATSPLILVYGLERYLDNFPYGCTEQLVSKVMPLLALNELPALNSDKIKLTQKMQDTIQMLAQRQLSDGSFSYWPNFMESDNTTFISLYALHFLTEAKAQGFEIPPELMNAGVNYLKNFAAKNTLTVEQARLQAYAIYLLTRNEMITTNYLTNLQVFLNADKTESWKPTIISAYLAATYQLLKDEGEAQRLITYYQSDKTIKNSDFYSQQIADAQYLYLVAKHFPNSLSATAKKFLMPLVTSLNTDAINTLLSGYTSLALGAYGQSYAFSPAQGLSISDVSSKGKTIQLVSSKSDYQKAQLAVDAKSVIFATTNSQHYFYQLTQAGFDKTLSTEPTQNGIDVYREYHDQVGNIITSVELGKEIFVEVSIRASNNDYIDNIAIVDLLPGGFEVVTDSVKADAFDYYDVREDRILFFGGITSEVKKISYKLKATNIGNYTIAPIVATSMYNPLLQGIGTTGKFTVN